MRILERLPVRGSAASYRLEARGGAIVIAFGALVSITTAGLDPDPRVNLLAGVLGLTVALAAFLVPLANVPHWSYVAISASVTAMISSVPASIHRPGDLGTGPIFYVCVVLHASIFMRRRESLALAGWNALCYLVIVVDELPVAAALAAWLTTAAALFALQASTATLRDGIDGLVGKLEVQAEHDGLTGLLNRQGLVTRLGAVPDDEPAALLVLDVDHFKLINDRFGHAAGDATLAWLGTLLHDHCRQGGDTGTARAGAAPLPRALAARFGGEEFVVWLQGHSRPEAGAWAEGLRQRVEDEARARLRPVTVSIGVASGRAGELVELLNRADYALYQAKREGRNVVRIAPERLEQAGPIVLG